jgi:hypothetical protein
MAVITHLPQMQTEYFHNPEIYLVEILSSNSVAASDPSKKGGIVKRKLQVTIRSIKAIDKGGYS